MWYLLERGVIIHVLEEPLLGELWVRLGLCDGLDVCFLEVVTFVEAGVGTCSSYLLLPVEIVAK